MIGSIIYVVGSVIRAIRNLFRGIRSAPDYVLFTLEGSYPELPDPPLPMWQRMTQKPRLSLRELGEQFKVVGKDSRVKGVILHLRPLSMSMSQLQTLRGFIEELKSSGKRVIAWSFSYQNDNYYVATAADEIIMLEDGAISPLGISYDFLYMGDGLKQIGLELDAIQITPYKTAPESMMRSSMSDEAREMMSWLADSVYEELVAGIAAGRGMSSDEARSVMDGTPYIDTDAQSQNVVDALMSEEELPHYLGESGKPAKIKTWEDAEGALYLPSLKKPGKYVAVLRIEGMIVDGRSQRPPMKNPFGIPFLMDTRAGDMSVVQDARKVLKDPRAAALVVFVDSGGGSATASEAMSAALRKVAEVKPVVVYMGSVAASGGYYASTPGQWIITQPSAITGSIGVVWGKVVNSGMLNKLSLNREVVQRGESMSLMAPDDKFSDEERTKIRSYIERVYDVFLGRVSDSRSLSKDDVDAVGGGRVWTGKQALEHKLIDELGNFESAITKARELAGLSKESAVREVRVENGELAPKPQPAATFEYLFDGIEILNQLKALYINPIFFKRNS